MERLLNQDERIRRAQEIYARRQNLREKTKRATVNISEPKNFKLLKKIALQLIICALIYFIFYLINTTNYTFSSSTLSKTNELISYDTDFEAIFKNIFEKINNYIYPVKAEENSETNLENNINVEENNTENGEDQENSENSEEIKQEENGENTGEVKQEENNGIIGETNLDGNIELNESTGSQEIAQVNISETDRIKKRLPIVVHYVDGKLVEFYTDKEVYRGDSY